MRASLPTLLLVTASLLAGCLGAGTADDEADADAASGSPTATPSVVPTETPAHATRPIAGHEAHPSCTTADPGCFVFVWVVGNQTTTPVAGPDDTPWRGQGAFCDHRNPAMPHFVHDVDETERLIRHRAERTVEPVDVLFVFDHFRESDCAIAYALVPDPVGRLPVDMGRGGSHTFAYDGANVTLDAAPIPAGAALTVSYDETETQGDWTLRHEGVFEVRNMGLWPQSALVPVEGSA